MLGEFLYQIAGRDEQLTWIEPYFEQTSSGPISNVAVIVDTLAVPERRILVLQSATSFAVSGAAQNSTWVAISAVHPSGYPVVRLTSTVATIASLYGATNWSGELYLLPGWKLRYSGVFNSGVNSNLIEGFMGGLLIPMGNVTRV